MNFKKDLNTFDDDIEYLVSGTYKHKSELTSSEIYNFFQLVQQTILIIKIFILFFYLIFL